MHRLSVLVVEDDFGVAELLRNLLTEEGAAVSIASDAQATRQALADADHDAVVLDVRLPGRENGFALAEVAAGHGCGVVLITGDHSLNKALAESGYRYLLKPFRVEQLREAIKQAIEDARWRARRGATE